MGDALSQTPYAQASPCRLPERRLLPTLHKFIFVFQFYILSREGCLQSTCGARASAHYLFLPLCPPLWGMRSHRRLMRKPIPAVFPSVGSCRLCTNLFLFFIFTFSFAGVISRTPVVPGPPRIFYFSPSVPHYGGCALTDALCAGHSLPSSRASADADIGSFL